MAGSFEKILRRQLSAKDFAWAPKGILFLPFPFVNEEVVTIDTQIKSEGRFGSSSKRSH